MAALPVSNFPQTFDIYVGVGSNINPESELRYGVECLRRDFGAIEVSSVYRSPAFGFVGDDFLNVVVKATTELDIAAVEARLDSIERSGERSSSGRFAPRALDSDLLMYGDCVDARRRLPRDDVLQFPFVLGPLAEIMPDRLHPLDGRSFAAHWAPRRTGAELELVCSYAELSLPADAASAVDGENLSGHVSGIAGKV